MIDSVIAVMERHVCRSSANAEKGMSPAFYLINRGGYVHDVGTHGLVNESLNGGRGAWGEGRISGK